MRPPTSRKIFFAWAVAIALKPFRRKPAIADTSGTVYLLLVVSSQAREKPRPVAPVMLLSNEKILIKILTSGCFKTSRAGVLPWRIRWWSSFGYNLCNFRLRFSMGSFNCSRIHFDECLGIIHYGQTDGLKCLHCTRLNQAPYHHTSNDSNAEAKLYL